MPRRSKTYHYIYRTTCLITGRFYVGMHSTDDLNDGYLGSGKVLRYSISKYGTENHRCEILEHLHSREALKLRESEVVNEELLADPLCINLKYGGEGGFSIDAGIKGNKSSLRDQKASRAKALETRKLNGSSNGHLGKKRNWESSAFSGKLHSEQTKQVMSQKAKLRVGSSNSQFGTCWVSNGTPIKIKKQDLEKYLIEGYSRGRHIAQVR